MNSSLSALSLSTIGEVFAHHALRDPAALALLCPGIEPLTFGELERCLGRLKEQFRAAGIGAGSRVGLALPRGPEAALISLAACSCATLLPINPTLAVDDIAAELARVRLDALIVAAGGEMPVWANAVQNEVGVYTIERGGPVSALELRQVSPVRRPRPEGKIASDSVAVIFRTSGTTGAAKRVPVTHGNLLEMARKMERWLRLTSADRSTCILPLYYNAGFKATLLSPLLIGCSVAMPATTSPHEIDQWVPALAPTWLTGAPAFLQSALERLRTLPAGALGSSLRFVLSTASYLPGPVREELDRVLGLPVVEFYGLGEAGMMTAPTVPPEKARPGTVGRPPAGELVVRGENGAEQPPGQAGQVFVRGPSVTPGYLYDIDDVPSGLEDGWLATGDLGVVDRDGFLSIVGRSKEIINRGGEKVSPYDVEKALLLHPAVREAAAFAVPHPRLGENVAAAVTLKPGTTATSSQLIDFLYDRLAPFQLPRNIAILDSLPFSAAGKISRAQLSATFGNKPRHVAQPEQPLQIQMAEIWQRFLQRTDIGIDDDFFELGGDSLQATEMLLELEELTGRSLPPSEIRAELTIRQLAKAFSRVASQNVELVTRVKDGTGTPLFLWHGDYDGWGLYARRLVELLKNDGPVFLVHSNLDTASGIGTIEDMGNRYLPHLQAVAPSGRVRLAGYCHGGLAAWEVAHRLEAAGREVESLAMIDAYSINARPMVRVAASAMWLLGKLAPGSLSDWARTRGMPAVWAGTRRLLRRDGSILSRILQRLFGRRGKTQYGPSTEAAQRWDYYSAMAKYVPPRIGAKVLCLLNDDYVAKKEFAADVWKPLAGGGVLSERIPGEHNTCITTHVVDLARTLNRHLAA